MEKRCFGCMKIKHSSPVCEHCGYDERSQNEQERLPVGTVLRGRYQIGKALGQGGFGITYIGWDNLLDIAVAVKEYFPRGIVMRDCAMNTSVYCYTNVREEYDKSKQRFLREAKTLAKFMHIPEIVRVQDFFEENDTAYIVMEYVDGINLHQYMKLRGGRLSVEHTLNLLKPVMEALIRVHEANIVHRDISPDNIMILSGGRTKLLDFGAVREVDHPDAEGMLTRSTQTILKRGFAPIEQYRSRGNLGPWTDVYALCATIYCCITGEVPVESQELLMEEERIPWEQIPGLSERRCRALQKGTVLLPNKRMRSVSELYAELYAAEPEPEPKPIPKPAPVPRPEPKPIPKPVPAPVPDLHTEPLRKPPIQPPEKDPVQPPATPRKPGGKLLTVIAAAALALAVGAVVLFGGRQEAKMSAPETTVPTVTEPQKKATEPSTIPETVPETIPSTVPYIPSGKDIINILVVGQSFREGEEYKYSDAMILVTVNKVNKVVTLTSFLQDTYVKLPDYKGYKCNKNRINVCYHLGWTWGGTGGAMEMTNMCLENNFGVKVDYNVEIDFDAFKHIVDALGGVRIDLNESEIKYLSEKIWYQDFVVGENRLFGDAALEYVRMCNVDGGSDIERTARQHNLVTAIAKKLINKGLDMRMELAYDILPMITTDMTIDEITTCMCEILPLLPEMTIESGTCPVEGTYRNEIVEVGGEKISVLKFDEAENKKLMTTLTQSAEETLAKE